MKKYGKIIDRFFWSLVIIGFFVGFFGIADRLLHGHSNLNYGSYVPWGLWVAGYIYLIGISAGAFMVAAVVYIFGIKSLERIAKLALITALSTVLGGLVLVWLDIGHMSRAWRMVFNSNLGSIMGWMFWFYTAYVLLLVIILIRAFRVNKDSSPEAIKKNTKVLKILCILGIPLTVAFFGAEGGIFGVVGARPFWNSAFTPLMFIVGAMLSGTAMVTFVTAMGSFINSRGFTSELILLGRATLILLCLYTFLEWTEYSIAMWNSVPALAAGESLVLFGPYWWVFWIVHVCIGVILPGLFLIFDSKNRQSIMIATGLIVLTFLSVRLNIVLPALAVTELHGLAKAFTGPGLNFDYFPSVQEWLVFVWSISFSALIFMLGKTYLPIYDENSKVTEEEDGK